ncbi:MAG: antitoxin Xre/MbcA/ParS toxin-binding domain-containing protein [Bacteroidota bacterium]
MDVNEPLIGYLAYNSPTALESYLKAILPSPLYSYSYLNVLKDKLTVTRIIRKGIPISVFEEIQKMMDFSDSQWASWLEINIRTLQRYRADSQHIFKPSQTERIFEIAEMIIRGNQVFDSKEHLQIWLNTPSLALGNESPLSFFENSYGKELVIAELDRIEYGVFV